MSNYIECKECGRTHHGGYLHPTEGYDCRCMRCGHEWRTKKPGDWPKSCSKCHSAYWDRPKLKDPTLKPPPKRKKKRKRVAVRKSGGRELSPPPSMLPKFPSMEGEE